MTSPIRSADLMAKIALTSPEAMRGLKDNTEATLKQLSEEAVRQLPQPSQNAADRVWLIIAIAFATVMVGSSLVLGTSVFSQASDLSNQLTRSDTMLTVFTTVVGFIAGLLSPSLLSKKNGAD